MNPVESRQVHCPWCGRPQEIAVDCTAGEQEYVEDCWICCRPMLIRIRLDPCSTDAIEVSVEREDA